MVTVTLKKIEENGNNYTWTFNNFRTWNGNVDFSIIKYPLPQEDSDQRILMKIMGNSTDMKYTWMMKDESSTVVTGTGDPVIKTVEEQIGFWLSTFRPKYLTDKYILTFNFTTPLVVNGIVGVFSWDIMDDSPVSATASFQYLEGTVVAANFESDTPSPPLNTTADSPGSGQLRQTWTVPENPGATAISNYVFKYRSSGSPSWNTVLVSSATFTHTISSLGVGIYYARMAALNDAGEGQNSEEKKVAVA